MHLVALPLSRSCTQTRTSGASERVRTVIKTALVIGGGIAGPVAAMALQKAGIDAVVYEAYSSRADGAGGGLSLAPNGLDALDTIGNAREAVNWIHARGYRHVLVVTNNYHMPRSIAELTKAFAKFLFIATVGAKAGVIINQSLQKEGFELKQNELIRL